MGPWIGRLDEQAFYANGRRYDFDMSLGNVRGEVPIHGFVTTTDLWRVTALEATTDAAFVTSRLDVYRQPAWMRQWPFAHTVEITYRLADGVLEVVTAVENLSAEPMPVSIGFHPYFQLTDTPRDEWQVAIAAKTRWILDARKLPTGQTEPTERLLPPPRVGLREYSLDEVFSDLVRDGDGRSTMTVWGKAQRLDVVLGPRYRSVVVWAPHPSGKGRGGQGDSPPAERNFICLEPMAGIGNAINLAHRGQYARAAVDRAGRDLARELLGEAERVRRREVSRCQVSAAISIHSGGGVIDVCGGPPGSGRPEPSSRLIARTVMS